MPNLDLNIIPTYNRKTIGIGDNSVYEKTPVTPTLEVTPPSFSKKTIEFTPDSLLILNSNTLGMTNEEVDTAVLPDGIWYIKYSVQPNYKTAINLTYLKTDELEEKFANAFLALDLSECDDKIPCGTREELKNIQIYIEGAKAAATVCNTSLANKLYKLADKKLNKFLGNGMQYC